MKKGLVCVFAILIIFSLSLQTLAEWDEERENDLLKKYPDAITITSPAFLEIGRLVDSGKIKIDDTTFLTFFSKNNRGTIPTIERMETGETFRDTYLLKNATMNVSSLDGKIKYNHVFYELEITFELVGEYKKSYETIPHIEDTINYYTLCYGKPQTIKTISGMVFSWEIDNSSKNIKCTLELINPSTYAPFSDALFPEANLTFTFK